MTVEIRKPLKKFMPLLLEAREEGLNEADTVLRLCRFFEEVLGFDGLRDISREAEMKGKYVDVCLKVDGRVKLLVEAKAADVRLRDKHIEQAQSYAARNNYRWVLLTNGVDWNLYHLTFDEGIEYERAFEVTLSDEDRIDDAAVKLALIHKKSLAKGQLDEYWDKATALGPSSIGRALFRENVLMLIRREIRRDAEVLIDREDLAKALHDMLTPDAREHIGPVKVRRRKKVARKQPVAPSGSTDPA
jgi:hypothetical protein